jgi:hypothetical protein
MADAVIPAPDRRPTSSCTAVINVDGRPLNYDGVSDTLAAFGYTS